MVEENIIAISRVFQYGKTQLPKEVRELLGIKDGDRIYYIQDETGNVYIRKAPEIKKERWGRYVIR